MTVDQLLNCIPSYVDILFHTDDDQIKGSWSVKELLRRSSPQVLKAQVLRITPIGAYTMIVEATTHTGGAK